MPLLLFYLLARAQLVYQENRLEAVILALSLLFYSADSKQIL